MFHREERNNKQWQQVTDQYPEMFREELDTMKGGKTTFKELKVQY